ncbi:MAG: hypothetical protein V3W37_07930 [Candidatus Binatia bacterium]
MAKPIKTYCPFCDVDVEALRIHRPGALRRYDRFQCVVCGGAAVANATRGIETGTQVSGTINIAHRSGGPTGAAPLRGQTRRMVDGGARDQRGVQAVRDAFPWLLEEKVVLSPPTKPWEHDRHEAKVLGRPNEEKRYEIECSCGEALSVRSTYLFLPSD